VKDGGARPAPRLENESLALLSSELLPNVELLRRGRIQRRHAHSPQAFVLLLFGLHSQGSDIGIGHGWIGHARTVRRFSLNVNRGDWGSAARSDVRAAARHMHSP
jgi:hypothetical protein